MYFVRRERLEDVSRARELFSDPRVKRVVIFRGEMIIIIRPDGQKLELPRKLISKCA